MGADRLCRGPSGSGREGRHLLRRPRRAHGRGDPADPEADDPGRRPADPLAHHEVVRAWGHTEFILCLGYKGESIKEYFLDYNEALSNDFVLRTADATSSCSASDIRDWRITFVDTGLRSDDRRAAAGGREPHRRRRVLPRDLRRRPHRRAARRDDRRRSVDAGRSRLFLSVRPQFNAHVVDADADGVGRAIDGHERRRTSGSTAVSSSSVASILDDISPGEELVDEPFARLIERGELIAYPLRGILGADGHDQGQAAARRAAESRPRSLADITCA